MPFPFLVLGAPLAIGLGIGWGIKKAIDAKSDFDAAESINEDAQEIFYNAKRTLERRREQQLNNLESLARQKIRLSKDALEPFVKTFRQIRNLDYEGINFQDENLRMISDEILEIQEVTIRMEEAVGGTTGALGSGVLAGLAAYGSVGLLSTASSGTAIASLSGAAATNATLAWLGGGSLAVGGLGATAAVLGGIGAAPVLLVGGLLSASKAEAAVEDALSNRYKAEAAAEAMETAGVAARAIGRKANEIRKVLKRLQEDHLDSDLGDLQNLVSTNADARTYNRSQKELVERTMFLAVTAKNLAEAPLLDEDGSITKTIRETLRDSRKLLKRLDDM